MDTAIRDLIKIGISAFPSYRNSTWIAVANLLIGGFNAGTALAAFTPGDIYTVAGNSTKGYFGDNGLATLAVAF